MEDKETEVFGERYTILGELTNSEVMNQILVPKGGDLSESIWHREGEINEFSVEHKVDVKNKLEEIQHNGDININHEYFNKE